MPGGGEEPDRKPTGAVVPAWCFVAPQLTRRTAPECSAADSAYRHFFGHMLKVFTRTNYLRRHPPHPEMADTDITVDAIIESRLIFGSPQTVLARLIGLRDQVGPFGNLLVSGMDWSGPNAAWERKSLSSAWRSEVMPAFRQRLRRRLRACPAPVFLQH